MGTTEEDVFRTYHEDGCWWCYYVGLATSGATRAQAVNAMREWLAEHDPDGPPDA